MRGLLKRKFGEVERTPSSSSSSSSPSCTSSESDGEGGSPVTGQSPPSHPPSSASLPIRSILKRLKLSKAQSSVRFGSVTVFSFPRCQGFTSVPRRGGATLGMAQKHNGLRRFTLAEHALERQYRRRERQRAKRRQEQIQALKRRLIMSGAVDQHEAERLATVQARSLEDSSDARASDGELQEGGSLQLYSSKQRQALLLTAGVKFIDREEKRQLHVLRLSREACGCDCRGFCEPESCACSLAGIKCQVDRFNFPCGCSKDGCGNAQGRIEFDARRVRTHHIHTLMKLKLDRRLQDEAPGAEVQLTLPQELHQHRDLDHVPAEQSGPDRRCPFGFGSEDDDLPVSMPATISLHLTPDCLAAEENSCSSDTTESSCLSTDSGFLSRSQSPPEVALNSLSDSENNTCSFLSRRLEGEAPVDGANCSASLGSAADYLDDNANQPRSFMEENSLEDFPETPSPTVDCLFGMDLSLSSDSDLEFFRSDYPSGPSQRSPREPRHPNGLPGLRLCGAVDPPQHDSSTRLLETLIGLTDCGVELAATSLL